jgi:hypothetical protein
MLQRLLLRRSAVRDESRGTVRAGLNQRHTLGIRLARAYSKGEFQC